MKWKWIILLMIIVLCWWFFLRSEGFLKGPIPREEGSIQVFFCPRENCESILLNRLRETNALECALYSLKLPNVTALLKEKQADLLIDEDNYAGLGKKIVMPGLMHNKFCVMDHTAVWTGSLNPTPNGAYKENNNLVLIRSQFLAKNYAQKFLDIKEGKHHQVKYSKLYINDQLVENYFCPEDDCEVHVLSTLLQAKKSIYFLTYSFTSDKIGDFLVANKDRLEIRGVMEKSQLNDYTEFDKFNTSHMNIRIDRNPFNMHHKVFIIDNETLITGSYNPTGGGNEKNRENILILHSTDLAYRFMEEFEQIWKSTLN